MTTISPLGREFDAIHLELAAVHWMWQNYCHLFVNSRADFDLALERLPGLTTLLHQVLRDFTIVGICRLCDPPKQQSITFDVLKTKLIPTPDSTQSDWIANQIEKIRTEEKPLRVHRDKRIAHFDAKILTPADVLPQIEIKTIDKVLALMRELMNKVGGWHKEPPCEYEILSLGDADAFVWCIQQANRLHELQNDAHFQKISPEQLIEKLKVRQFTESALP